MGEGVMRSTIASIRENVDATWNSAEGFALKIRMNLAELALCELKERGWSQRKLARKTGWKEPFVSKILNGDANWTTETAGRLLFALDIEPELDRAKPDIPRWRYRSDSGETITLASVAHGKEVEFQIAQAASNT